MTEKYCRGCETLKSISNFHKCAKCKDGFGGKCKICAKNKVPIKVERVYLNGLQVCKACELPKDISEFYLKIKNNGKTFTDTLCKKCRLLKAKTEETPQQKERKKLYIKEYHKTRRRSDPIYKMQGNVKSLIKIYLKRLINGYTKTNSYHSILGCTAIEFKDHIERQFLPWMNWENHGKYNGELDFGWDLDHIIPLTCFCEEDLIIKFNHWSNFQPLCSKVNRDEKINSLFPLTNLELQITIEICQ